MRGASNPDGRIAAPVLLRFARNDAQGIASLVSASRLSSPDSPADRLMGNASRIVPEATLGSASEVRPACVPVMSGPRHSARLGNDPAPPSRYGGRRA